MSTSLRSNRTAAPSLTLSDWGWRHAGRKAWALHNVSFSTRPGECILVLGASGSGKSTLLHAIAGLLRDGEDGESAGSLSVQSQGDVQRSVGLVLQDPDAQLMMSRVGDDVAFGCENLGVPRDELWKRVSQSLEAVGLRVALDSLTEELSGGQKQRLALAAALAMQPDILVLDEPTAMLDPSGVEEVHQAVAQLAYERTRTIILVEHQLDRWLDVIDRVIVLDGGTVVADDSPREVLETHRAQLESMGVWLPSTSEPVRSRAQRTTHAGESLLTARDLSCGWNGRPANTVAELTLQSGSILAITAPNGAGKSTLALTLGGLLDPVSGLLDPNPAQWSSRELVRRVGTVFQTPEHQFVMSTVRAELELGAREQHLSDAQRADLVRTLAERLRLLQLLDAHPHTLSGGEKRRLSVATALAAKPPILILDEPTFGQDAHTWRELADLLIELRDQGSAIVAITHDSRFVAEIADRELQLTPSPSQPVLRSMMHTTNAPRERILRVNPVAKIIASAVLSVALIVTLDWLSALVALACTIPLLAWSGLSGRQLVIRLAPIVIAATLAGVTTVLYGQTSGEVWFQFGLIEISDGSLELAIATALRVLAIGIPAVVLFTTIEPVDLADSLEQRTRLPARFIQGSLVAMRLLTAVRLDWDALSRARRSRGLGDSKRLTRFLHQSFALFVLSLRRADKLSLAMQSRAFDSGTPRSWARSSSWGVAEWMLIVIAVAVAAVATTAALFAGTWHFVLGGWA